MSPSRLLNIGCTAESDVARGGVRGIGSSGRATVAVAVAAMTKITASAHDPGLAPGRADGILPGSGPVPGWIKPVGHPFPHIAGGVP